MNEQEALALMIPPGQKRAGKWRGGVIQIHLTRACDKSCYNCTQGSNYGGRLEFMTLANVEIALRSLKGYFGVVGIFGGNPALHPQFDEVCDLIRAHFPKEQCGLWCNNPISATRAHSMRLTFSPAVSNLNVHMDPDAYRKFKEWWPESAPFGLDKDSRHAPVYVAMRDVLKKPCPRCKGIGIEPGTAYPYGEGDEYERCTSCDNGGVYDEAQAWELISGCDINRHWSAMIGQFRGEARAWFCEIAGAQAMLHQHEPGYPDTGCKLDTASPVVWWQQPMQHFMFQVRKHCHECGVPMRGYGELANACEDAGTEQSSATHQEVAQPKRSKRRLELVTVRAQLQEGKLDRVTHYMQNASK